MTNCEHEVEFAERLAIVDQRSKSNTHRLDEMEQRQANLEDLTSSVATLAAKQEHVESDVKEIKTDVKALAAVPGKRWEGLVSNLISLLAGALVAWIASGMPGV